MDAPEYIRRQFIPLRRLASAALQNTTDEQFNWQPPGEANAIKTSLIHLLAAEDMAVQNVIQGKPMIWETGSWSEKVGLPYPPGRGRGWDEIRATDLRFAPVMEYAQAVWAATDAYLAALTSDELTREVSFMGGQRPVADVLATDVVHVMGHAGDIAAIKGIQGIKGLPF